MTKTKRQRNAFIPAYVILACLVILHFLPLLLPGSRTWGFNHLLFIPETYTYIFIAVGAVILLIPFLGIIYEALNRAIEAVSQALFVSGYKYPLRLLIVLVFGFAFFFFRGETFFLGDDYNIIANFSSGSIPLIKWTEAGTVHLYSFILTLLGNSDESIVISVVQVMSVIAGMISVWMIFMLAGEASENPVVRFLIAVTFKFSGLGLMFFGYIEYYPPSWPVILAFVNYALKELNGKGGLIPASIFLVAGLYLHLQFIYFVPAFVFLVLKSKRFSPYYARWRKSILIAIGTFAGIIFIVFIYKYVTSLYIQDIFLPPFEGKPVDRSYAVFSITHLLDVINELLLLAPLLPLLVFAAIGSLRKNVRTDPGRFLSIASVFCLLPLFVVDPKLGMPRDWDLFSFAVLTLSILLILAAQGKLNGFLKKIVPSIVLLAVIAPIPFWATNLNTEPSIKYTRYMIELDVLRAHPTLRSLFLYYKNNDMQASADSLPVVYARQNAYADQINYAFMEMKENNFRPTEDFFRRFPADEFDADFHHLKGVYYLKHGKFRKALASLDSAIMLRDQFGVYYHQRAQAYAALQDFDRSLEDMRRAYRYDPDNKLINASLAGLFITKEQYDSSIYYAKRLLGIDSSEALAYLYLSKASALKGNKPDALRYLKRFTAVAGDNSPYAEKAREIALMISRMK